MILWGHSVYFARGPKFKISSKKPTPPPQPFSFHLNQTSWHKRGKGYYLFTMCSILNILWPFENCLKTESCGRKKLKKHCVCTFDTNSSKLYWGMWAGGYNFSWHLSTLKYRAILIYAGSQWEILKCGFFLKNGWIVPWNGLKFGCKRFKEPQQNYLRI